MHNCHKHYPYGMVTRMFVVVPFGSGHCRLRSSINIESRVAAQACEEGRELTCKRMDRMQERGFRRVRTSRRTLAVPGVDGRSTRFVGVLGYVLLGWILL
jgi:hypothetical protein